MISIDTIKALRDKTGVSVMQCRQALEEAKGDMEKALFVLQKQSSAIAQKKSGRALGAGVVASYIHTGGAIGALLELNCETDFVAKNPEFKALASDLVMHVAAMAPENTEELAAQPFVKDPSKTVADLISSNVQKFGERTEISRFSRFSVLGN
ncbi:MAG: translation elongation factor Ts [Candidatus Vogelbacteria bacterium]|nr:translation elongation factor Ts [Candidatus Vogelbacteria bacterium]